MSFNSKQLVENRLDQHDLLESSNQQLTETAKATLISTQQTVIQSGVLLVAILLAVFL